MLIVPSELRDKMIDLSLETPWSKQLLLLVLLQHFSYLLHEYSPVQLKLFLVHRALVDVL